MQYNTVQYNKGKMKFSFFSSSSSPSFSSLPFFFTILVLTTYLAYVSFVRWQRWPQVFIIPRFIPADKSGVHLPHHKSQVASWVSRACLTNQVTLDLTPTMDPRSEHSTTQTHRLKTSEG